MRILLLFPWWQWAVFLLLWLIGARGLWCLWTHDPETLTYADLWTRRH